MHDRDYKTKTVMDLLFETASLCDALLDDELPIGVHMRDEINGMRDKLFSLYNEYGINNF
jgi:hypothetical protein